MRKEKIIGVRFSAVIMLILSNALFFLASAKVNAEELPFGPLIQATTPMEEYRGLVNLDLLQTQESPNGHMEDAIPNVLPSVVRIRTGNFTGSGIILEINQDTLLLASNRHQLINNEFSGVQLYTGDWVSARRIFLSEKWDIGFALADISMLPYETRGRLRCIRTSDSCERSLEKGTEMFLVGSADKVAGNIYCGEVSDPWFFFDEFDSYMIYNYCEAKPGMSGGGTYDAHGHCIGMTTGGYEDETASLPMQLIREEWRGLDYDKN